jgi:alanine racemase
MREPPLGTDQGPHGLRPNLYEIDLDAISDNLATVQALVGADVKVFAVLKGNAYGFGLLEVGAIVEVSATFGIAVGSLLEAIALRRAAVTKPILVYPNNLPEAASEYLRYDLLATVPDVATAEAYARAADRTRKLMGVFAKVDVGLYRNGVPPGEAAALCARISRLSGLRLDGVLSHLHMPHPERVDDPYVIWQCSRFSQAVSDIEAAGIEVPIRMIAHSAMIGRYPAMHLNAVDPGKLIYGIGPPGTPGAAGDFRPALRALRTRLIAVKTVSGGTPFDAEGPFAVGCQRRIGIVPMGWGDGFPKLGQVLIRGRRVDVLGAPSVEHARIALDDCPDAEVGDDVIVIGRQGPAMLPAVEVAGALGIGVSELTRGIRDTVARLYYRHGKPWKITSILGETCLAPATGPASETVGVSRQ